MTPNAKQQQKPNYSTRSFDFLELTNRATIRHTAPVGANHQQTAKFRDSNPLTRRQTRHDDAAGFFMPVEYASGFMPGMRGLQNGVNRNKRVVFLVSDLSTRQLLPNQRNKLGAVTMTAMLMGNTAQNPLARLPHIPFAPAFPPRKPDTGKLVFTRSRTGFIVYKKGTPLAWLVLGYHQGQLDNKPKLVKFVDVAYHRQTERGISMETAFFDTVAEAKQFIRATLGEGVAK